ncbi:hypothetical protein FKB34_16025 [Glycocaulis profundi]|nr:hypothetical protein FKB34_16025 [Glycocaulis profundi]
MVLVYVSSFLLWMLTVSLAGQLVTLGEMAGREMLTWPNALGITYALSAAAFLYWFADYVRDHSKSTLHDWKSARSDRRKSKLNAASPPIVLNTGNFAPAWTVTLQQDHDA